MSCSICNRSSCASWMHSAEERERYSEVIELEEQIQELRNRIAEKVEEIEAEDEEDGDE